MSTGNSTNTVIPSVTESKQQLLTSSVSRSVRRRVQNTLLVWLDSGIDDSRENTQNTITQLRHVINEINTFTDGEQCIQFLEETKDNKVCLIISGVLGQDVVPRVHDLSQVESIFIFCQNQTLHKAWTKDWSKIKGVHQQTDPICTALRVASKQCEQDAMPISFVPTNNIASDKQLNHLDPSFMYTTILKKILFTIQFEARHFNEYIEHCRVQFAENDRELTNIDKLEKDYRNKTPIWWYTYECFLYPMLNLGLRTMDTDIIVKMGFFINDLSRHIEQLHSEQFDEQFGRESFTVYRGQGLTVTNFEEMKKSQGGLMSFNNFLSTSKNRDVSMVFAHNALTKPDCVGVLFIMKIDSDQCTTPFASIGSVSYFGDEEDEVLFSMHSVFRVNSIDPMGENDRLFQVNLTLTTDNDDDLRRLTDRIEQEVTFVNGGWFRLGIVLQKMGHLKKAEDLFSILLEQCNNETEQGYIYHQTAKTKHLQGEYVKANGFYEDAINIYKKTLSPNHLDFALVYNDIGNVQDSMGDYPQALSYHEKALAIRQQSLPSDHSDLATSYYNIGNVHDSMDDYPQALSYYEKALAIRQQSLPAYHPELAASYESIGNVHHSMGDYSQALSYYEKTLAIRKQSLPSNHPSLASSYTNIGWLSDKMGDYGNALVYHRKALVIFQESLPPTHPNLGNCYNNIGLVYSNMGNHVESLSFHEKGLAIRQQSLSADHPDLAESLNNIGLVYMNIGDDIKALSHLEKALVIRQRVSGSNNPDLGETYHNLGMVYKNMNDYTKALSYLEKGFSIRQQTLASNHPDLAVSCGQIGHLYLIMNEDFKALSCFQRAVNIAQRFLSSTHPHRRWYTDNLDNLKKERSQSLSFSCCLK